MDRRTLLQWTAAWLVARPLAAAASGVTVVLRTSLGDVEIEVDAARARRFWVDRLELKP